MEVLSSQRVSVSEQLFPFLVAAMEACLIDMICIGLANIGFLGNDVLLPLWLPFPVLLSACWLTRYPTRRMLLAFPSLQRNAERQPPPLITLCVLVGIIELLFGVCSIRYTASVFNWSTLFQTTYVSITTFDVGRLIVAIVIVGFLCWRGIQIARLVIDNSQIERLLRVGLVSVFVIVLLRSLQELFYPNTFSHDDVAFFFLVTLFVCVCLFAYPLAQRAYLFRFYSSGIRESFRRQEYLFLCLLALFCLFALISLWTVIILYNHWLVFGIKLGNPQMKPGINGPQSFPFIPPNGGSGSGQHALISIFSWFKIVLLALLVSFIVILLVRFIRRALARLPQQGNETHESIWSWVLFWQQFRAIVAAFLLRFSPFQKVQRKEQGDEEQVASSELPLHTIRQVYAALLRQASRTGYSRNLYETPNEFRNRLAQNLSFAEPYLREITDAYLASRYGECVYDEVEMIKIQKAWSDLQQKWQESSSVF